ncbi:MAG: DUF4276 family protein [Magnetococcus sp. DMHC-6]
MTVIRLHVTAEGPTEELFVNKILVDHLGDFNVSTDVRAVLTSKDNKASIEYRGGLGDYQKAKKDILTWMKEDDRSECRFTTMFDLYALPDNFPGFAQAQQILDPYEKVKILEEAFATDMEDHRFIPYIQLHEFEALIFADPQKLDWEYLEHDLPIKNLQQLMIKSPNPELINDHPQTAPSKRILKEIPEYDKVTAGVSVVGRIGLPTLREKCRHFAQWLQRLESCA